MKKTHERNGYRAEQKWKLERQPYRNFQHIYSVAHVQASKDRRRLNAHSIRRKSHNRKRLLSVFLLPSGYKHENNNNKNTHFGCVRKEEEEKKSTTRQE